MIPLPGLVSIQAGLPAAHGEPGVRLGDVSAIGRSEAWRETLSHI
jgi:hypothetical protein